MGIQAMLMLHLPTSSQEIQQTVQIQVIQCIAPVLLWGMMSLCGFPLDQDRLPGHIHGGPGGSVAPTE
jgi:hypothetical protein